MRASERKIFGNTIKIWLGIILIIVIAAFFILRIKMEAGPEKVFQMRFGHYATTDHPANIAALQFSEAVHHRTEGRIIIKVHPDNQLGSPPELLEQNIAGVIDMSLPTQGALDKYSKKFAVVMLPFVFRDYAHAHSVLDGVFMDWAAAELDQQGLVYLSNWEWGFRNLTSNVRPIHHPQDMQGLRIRTPPEIQLQAAMEACGARVMVTPFPQLYASLSNGVVDGQENPLSVIYHNRLFEVQKYLAMTRHVYNSMVHVMSKRVWEKLSPEDQAVIREESLMASAYMRKAVQSEERDLIAKLQLAGMQITWPDTAPFRLRMRPAYERISKYAGNGHVEAFLPMIGEVK